MATPERLFLKSLDWEDIRAFLVRRKWLREEIGDGVFDMICERQTSELSGCLMRELSVWISGYLNAKPPGRERHGPWNR